MRTLLLAAAVLCAHSITFAQSCEKVEYAQLKDSTKKELSDEFCSAMLKADLNDKLGQSQLRLANSGTQARRTTDDAMKSYSQHSDAQVACLRAADAASSMLQKKFKASKPVCK